MLTRAMQELLNDQIKHEFASAYLYLAMSAWCEAQTLPGLAKWLRLQGQEEAGHALKLFDHMNDRGARVSLRAIEQPHSDFKLPLDVFQEVLEHERKVTGTIHQLYAQALQDNDYASQAMLQWFITEQVEEEKRAAEIVAQLKMIGDSGPALLMLDRQMAARAAG